MKLSSNGAWAKQLILSELYRIARMKTIEKGGIWAVYMKSAASICDLSQTPPDLWVESFATKQVVLTLDWAENEEVALSILPICQQRILNGNFGIQESFILAAKEISFWKINSDCSYTQRSYSDFLGIDWTKECMGAGIFNQNQIKAP